MAENRLSLALSSLLVMDCSLMTEKTSTECTESCSTILLPAQCPISLHTNDHTLKRMNWLQWIDGLISLLRWWHCWRINLIWKPFVNGTHHSSNYLLITCFQWNGETRHVHQLTRTERFLSPSLCSLCSSHDMRLLSSSPLLLTNLSFTTTPTDPWEHSVQNQLSIAETTAATVDLSSSCTWVLTALSSPR